MFLNNTIAKFYLSISLIDSFVKIVQCQTFASYSKSTTYLFSGGISHLLNQARASRRPVHVWFLKIDPVRIVSMCVYLCVCVSAPEAINN